MKPYTVYIDFGGNLKATNKKIPEGMLCLFETIDEGTAVAILNAKASHKKTRGTKIKLDPRFSREHQHNKLLIDIWKSAVLREFRQVHADGFFKGVEP